VQSRLKTTKGIAPPKGLSAKRAGIRGESRRDGTSQRRVAWQDERRELRWHARHAAFVGSHDEGGVPGVYPAVIGRDAQAILDQVKALESDQLLGRYHELVDKRLQGALRYTELFELERIEARLDNEDQDEATRLTILQDDWRRERNELVASIEHLLARFKTAS